MHKLNKYECKKMDILVLVLSCNFIVPVSLGCIMKTFPLLGFLYKKFLKILNVCYFLKQIMKKQSIV